MYFDSDSIASENQPFKKICGTFQAFSFLKTPLFLLLSIPFEEYLQGILFFTAKCYVTAK